jgi:hypothetical protein
MAAASERASAQRRLARQIKTGTYQPSNIGAKARKAATELIQDKTAIIDQIQDIKRDAFGDRLRWNEALSRQHVKTSPETGKNRGIEELRKTLKDIRQWDANGRDDDWEELADISSDSEDSVFYYHGNT